jgi:hypothetical protein
MTLKHSNKNYEYDPKKLKIYKKSLEPLSKKDVNATDKQLIQADWGRNNGIWYFNLPGDAAIDTQGFMYVAIHLIIASRRLTATATS